jgi:hypothetical protein
VSGLVIVFSLFFGSDSVIAVGRTEGVARNFRFGDVFDSFQRTQ